MRMFTLTALGLTTALAVASPSFAQATNAGSSQLAAEAGVPDGVLSAGDLYRLIRAKRDQDSSTIDFLLAKAGINADGTPADMVAVAPSEPDLQLAAEAGVEPGVYTNAEMQRLILAMRNNDEETVDYILSGGNREMTMEKSAVTPGEEQLAAELGVNPALYTLAELVEMKARVEAARSDG